MFHSVDRHPAKVQTENYNRAIQLLTVVDEAVQMSDTLVWNYYCVDLDSGRTN